MEELLDLLSSSDPDPEPPPQVNNISRIVDGKICLPDDYPQGSIYDTFFRIGKNLDLVSVFYGKKIGRWVDTDFFLPEIDVCYPGSSQFLQYIPGIPVLWSAAHVLEEIRYSALSEKIHSQHRQWALHADYAIIYPV